MKTNATFHELNLALAIVNKKYTGNISLFDVSNVSKNRVRFRLKAIAGLNGARKSPDGKNLPFASWHVHGEFFDALFSIREDIFIYSGGKKITIAGGNWEDRNIGSIMQPCDFSEVSIIQDDREYFTEKIADLVTKLGAKRIRNIEKAKGQLLNLAASVRKTYEYSDEKIPFPVITKLIYLERGDITKLIEDYKPSKN